MVTKAAKKKIKESPEETEANKLAAQAIEISRYRNDKNLMRYPFCSTSKKTRFKPINYRSSDGKRWLDVSPSVQYGMAKIWDFDIIRFALSKAGEVSRKIDYFPKYVEFTIYECLKSLKRDPENGKNIIWFREAIRRLVSTTYVGNIFRDNVKTESGFTLIRYELLEDAARGGFDKVKIRFDERLIESMVIKNGLLAIDSDVIREESGVKKRLLELVRVYKGKNKEWTVRLSVLAEMCAHEGALKRFKFELPRYELPWEIKFSKSNIGKNVIVSFSDKK